MRKKLHPDSIEALYESLLSLKTPEECEAFLEDLCTVAELKALAQRFEVARLLNDGFTYAEVAEKTGASSTTVSTVNRCIENGAGGYTLALERYKENHK